MKKLVWFLLCASAFGQTNSLAGYAVSSGLYSGDKAGVCKSFAIHVGPGTAALSDGTTFATPNGASVTISSTTATTYGYVDTGGNVSSSTQSSVPAGDYPILRSDPNGFCQVKVTDIRSDLFFGGSGGGGGSVNSATAPSSLFNTPINPVGLVLNFSFINTFPGNEVFGVCTAGSNTPGPCSITAAMLPASITSNTSGTAAGLSANIAESQVTNLVTDLGDLAFKGGLGGSFQDVTEVAAPANPSAGNERIYANSSTHSLSCLTSAGGNCFPAGPFSGLTGSTNTTAAMVVGTGASLSASGSGSITATALPFSGLTTATNTTATMTVGSGATLNGASGGIVDFSAIAPTAFKHPVLASAAPTADGQEGTDATTHYWNFGANGSTLSVAAWAGDISGNTALSPQVTATHLSSALPIAQGGTAGATNTIAFNNLAPSGAGAGDIIYNNGTNWVRLAGNNTGTQFLQETNLGVPSWAATAASVGWNSISNATGVLTLANGTFGTTFNHTAAANWFWANNTAATSTVAQNSPIFNICGQGWEGSTPANTQDCWTIQNNIPNGPNPDVTLLFGNSGSTSGNRIVSFPGPVIFGGSTTAGCSGASGSCLQGTEGSSNPGGSGGTDQLFANATSHRWQMNNNNTGVVNVVASGVDINTSDQVTSVHLTSAPTACTNQALTALSTTLASTCNTITSAYVDTSVAVTNGTNVYTGGPQDLNVQVQTEQVANASVTGTTVNLLAKLTSTGAVKAGTSDSAVPLYIVVAGAGTTGNAKLAIGGQTLCTMDATASNTEGFLVISSNTTAGNCHAVTPPLAPVSGTFIVGTLISNSTTLGANATVSVSPYFVNPSGAGGGSGTVNSGTGGQITGYTATGSTVSGLPNETFSNGDVTFGQAGSVQGSLSLAGATSGTTKLAVAAAASGTLTLPSATDTVVARATTDTLTNKTYDTAGTGNVFKANGSQGTTGQVLRATTSSSPQYIDFPDVHIIPAANCNNTTAGPGWSIGSGGTVTCRAGTNNKGGFISITDTSTTFATFQVAIPEDWDSGSNPFIRFQVASTDATSGHTIIPSVQVACYKGDGSTTDDVAANAAHSLSTVTLNTTANQFWSTSNVQMNSTDMTGCVAGAIMQVTVGRATDTATNAEFYSATITFPRLLTVQAN